MSLSSASYLGKRGRRKRGGETENDRETEGQTPRTRKREREGKETERESEAEPESESGRAHESARAQAIRERVSDPRKAIREERRKRKERKTIVNRNGLDSLFETREKSNSQVCK